MNLEIAGLGTAVPPHELSAETAVELVQRVCCENDKQRRLAAMLYRQSGIRQRQTVVPAAEAYRWIAGGDRFDPALHMDTEGRQLGLTTAERGDWYRDHATPLAMEAARNALADGSIEAKQVTHLVTVSCTGSEAPGVDMGLIHQLSLPASTQRVNVGFMGCHGAINGLRVANALASDPNAVVLMVAVELCSIHYCFHWDRQRMLGNALFADGAAAIVGTSKPTDSQSWRVLATGSTVIPNSASAMSWRVGNHGYAMTLSSELPELIEQNVGGWLSEWLAEQGHTVESVGNWAVHPGGPRVLEAVESALGLASCHTEDSRQVLAQHGNMSSATVLFIAQRLRQRGAAKPCVMLGFGPGLVAEVALLG